MVQSYLSSYPFHVNTHTHSKLLLSTRSLLPPLSASTAVSVTVTNDALSVVRIALQRGREWHLLATPHVHSRRFPLPSPPSSRAFHKTRVNGSAITPNPFSKRPPSREGEIEGGIERGLYTNGRAGGGASLCRD